jgi:hypothetical protein
MIVACILCMLAVFAPYVLAIVVDVSIVCIIGAVIAIIDGYVVLVTSTAISGIVEVYVLLL